MPNSIVSFSIFVRFCTGALDLVVIIALHREILLRVLGPAELLIVLADVEDLENLRSIRSGEHDRNLPVPLPPCHTMHARNDLDAFLTDLKLGASRLYVDSARFGLNPRIDFFMFVGRLFKPKNWKLSAPALRIFLVSFRAPGIKI